MAPSVAKLLVTIAAFRTDQMKSGILSSLLTIFMIAGSMIGLALFIIKWIDSDFETAFNLFEDVVLDVLGD